MDFLRQLFGPGDFMPRDYCYVWNPGLVWLHPRLATVYGIVRQHGGFLHVYCELNTCCWMWCCPKSTVQRPMRG